MTAINAFYDRDDRYAYLASDGAAFSYDDGTVVSLGGKITVFPEFRIALAFTGPNIGGEIVSHVCQQPIIGQTHALQLLQDAMLSARKGMAKGKPAGEISGINDIRAIAVVYLEAEKRPAIYSFVTNPAASPGCPVNRWHEIEGVFVPSEVPAYIAERGMYVDDAVHDCRALFRAQRHHNFEGMHCAPAVGGTCSLYRVGPDGIKAWDILEFADKVGAVADIADTGTDALRPVSHLA
jgi:hypothetical protein